MADAKKCDICGKYYDSPNDSALTKYRDHNGFINKKDVCSECSQLIESFIESRKEGTLAVGLLDYLISIYGEDELLSMLKKRGDKNGETEN